MVISGTTLAESNESIFLHKFCPSTKTYQNICTFGAIFSFYISFFFIKIFLVAILNSSQTHSLNA